MKIENLVKFNYKLPEDYFIWIKPNNGWALIRTTNGKKLLDSETDTEKELKKFVKEHSFYNIMDVSRIEILVINTLGLILSLINAIFIHSTMISGIVFGMILVLIPLLATNASKA